VCGPGRPGGEALDSPWQRVQRYPPDRRVFQCQSRFRRRHGHQVLDAPHVQQLNQLAQDRKGQGQKARGRCTRGFSSKGREPRERGGLRAPGQALQ
jgi:hypothetical protein